jgi:hypothetical protein
MHAIEEKLNQGNKRGVIKGELKRGCCWFVREREERVWLIVACMQWSKG